MSANSTLDTGGIVVVPPAFRKVTDTMQRPTLPLPSTNGWIASNWAWAIAARTTLDVDEVLMNSHRSSISSGIIAGGGGTYATPSSTCSAPIQFCSVRYTPSVTRWLVP
ncbi:MAG: hypothetical protein R2694_18335 [Ilumatobacteraceae bacterium]